MIRRHNILFFVFFLSGISGLIYEVVWLRMLIKILGSTVYASSTVLAVFMGGLGLGGLWFGRLADRSRRLLRVYALLEISIGVIALLIPAANRFGVVPTTETNFPVPPSTWPM